MSAARDSELATYLDHILERHRAVAADDTRSLDDLIEAATAEGPPRGFRRALAAAPALAVIAEIKRRSPAKGDLDIDLIAPSLAQTYEVGGATCLSVLTDEEFFAGSVQDLKEARAATDLPVLRKDFTVSERDVCDARIMGADCVLLIAAALPHAELSAFHALAMHLGLDALVEVHDEAELAVALEIGATLVGVNQRDLSSFEVDSDRAERLAARIPDEVVSVAESGVRDGDAARRLRDAGFDAVLVGETLVTADDPIATLGELRV